MARRRRGVLLVLVLASLALAAGLIMPLALLSGTTAVIESYRADDLRHRLAAESVVAILPSLLDKDHRLVRDLDRSNEARRSFELDGVRVDVLIQDDTAKLPLRIVMKLETPAITDALSLLEANLALPHLRLRGPAAGESLNWSACLDDLFEQPSDSTVFGTTDGPPVWVRFLSPVGQRVHAYRAVPAVLEAALSDLRRGLGQRIADARRRQSKPDLDELLKDLDIPVAILEQVRKRLTNRTQRYSLLVRTSLAGDVRQRFMVCDLSDPPRVIVDWEIAP